MTLDCAPPKERSTDPTHRLWRAFSTLFAGFMKEGRKVGAEHGLTMPQFMLMRGLLREGAVPTTFWSEHIGISPSAASELAESLVAAGFAVRSPDPSDRRKRLISLSPRGRKIMQEVEEKMMELWRARCEGLSANDLATATGIIERMQANVVTAGKHAMASPKVPTNPRTRARPRSVRRSRA